MPNTHHPNERKRVLIMSTSAGTGHTKAGEALEKTFRQHPRVAEVIHQDALKYTNKLFRDFYSKFYTSLVRSAPDFLGWWYKTSDEPWKTDAMRHALDRLNTGPLVKFMREFDPHVTICTHFMPAGIMSYLIARDELQSHLSIVVTDFDFHAMWLSRTFHRYFVAIDETKAHLELLGLPSDRITVSGIPIDPIFSAQADRPALRAKYNLDPALPVLLLSGGALGTGPTSFVLERLLQLRNPAQIVVICGHSQELRARVEEVVQGKPLVTVVGYTNDMWEWMNVSSLFIGKPGGLTTCEALACGLPMVIVSPIPGQEERNSDHLLENGIAIRCNEMTTIAYKIDRLLDDPERLRQMRECALKFARPDAAETITRTVVETDREGSSPVTISEDQRDAMALASAKSTISN